MGSKCSDIIDNFHQTIHVYFLVFAMTFGVDIVL